MNEEKVLNEASLELGEYFGHGVIFYDWEKEFGIFSTTAPVKFAEEIPAYYKKVENVIKAVLETLEWSERTDSIVRLINNYVHNNGYDTEEVKRRFSLYNQKFAYQLKKGEGKEAVGETSIHGPEDSFLDDLYNELIDTVVQDRYDLFEYQPEDIEHNSYVKGEEFNKILNSLPLDKILMNEIINELL